MRAIQDKQYDQEQHGWYCHESDFHNATAKYADPDFGDLGEELSDDICTDLKYQPYVYQKDIIRFCTENNSSLIVADCGAGKSYCMIGAYHELRKSGAVITPALIVVKASLKVQWFHEVTKFSDYVPKILNTYKSFKPAKRDEEFTAQFKDADILIANYETLRDEAVLQKLQQLRIQFIAADEIVYIKDASTKRAKALYKLSSAKYKIGATATPIQKNPFDIFGIFKFLVPKLFPSKTTFGVKYVRYGVFNQVIGGKNEAQLNRELAPYLIIKDKKEIASQLPELQVFQRMCDFSPRQKRQNEALMKRLEDLKAQQEDVGKKIKANSTKQLEEEMKSLDAQIMTTQTFLQELADSEKLLTNKAAVQYVTGDPDPKLSLLIDLLTEIIEVGERVVVFSKYVRMQEIITEAVQKAKIETEIAYVNGSMSAEERYDNVYNKFQSDDNNCKLLIMSEAGSEGINLSKCAYMIEYEPADSYAVQTQRHGRIQRADSVASTSRVYQLIVLESWDEVATRIIAKKEGYDQKVIRGAI